MRLLRLCSCELVVLVFFFVVVQVCAEFIIFVSLVSPLASYVSGHTLEVTGGAGI